MPTYYWCFRCKDRFFLRGQEITCPTCHDGFVAEFPRIQLLRQEQLVSVNLPHRRASDRSFAIVEPSGPNGRPRIRGLIEFEGRESNDNEDRGRSGPDPQHTLGFFGASSSSGRAGFIFHGQFSQRRNTSHLQETVQHTLDYESQGPLPLASRAAIDLMPNISSGGRANHRGNLFSCFWPFGSSSSNTHRGRDRDAETG